MPRHFVYHSETYNLVDQLIVDVGLGRRLDDTSNGSNDT